jgi:hypothetical protein
MDEFKTWSELNSHAQAELKPDLGFASFSKLSPVDRNIIWHHLYREYFFNNEPKGEDYEFKGEPYVQQLKMERAVFSVVTLNEKFKKNSYAYRFLENQTYYNAFLDFYTLFMGGVKT